VELLHVLTFWSIHQSQEKRSCVCLRGRPKPGFVVTFLLWPSQFCDAPSKSCHLIA